MDVKTSMVHRLFYPQVPLVLSASSGGRVSAMPVVSYASVSEKPSLVAVSCNPQSYTCKLAVKGRAFSLCLLDADRTDDVAKLATISGRGSVDKLKDAGIRYSPGPELGLPILDGSEASMELRLKSKLPIGDHLLLLGLIVSAVASDAFGDYWDFRQYSPILYAGWRDGLTTYSGS